MITHKFALMYVILHADVRITEWEMDSILMRHFQQGRDAAACVDYLARIGKAGVSCEVIGGPTLMTRIGNGQIVGTKGTFENQAANW